MAFMTKEWKGTEPFPIKGFHHVEFIVGNAKQAAHFYRSAFGFKPHAYRGPETGTRDRVSYVVKQNHVFIQLTTPLAADHPLADWHKKHGDGCIDVGFAVEDAATAYKMCLERGAKSAQAPQELKDEHGTLTIAAVKTYGDTVHSLISGNYKGVWQPGFKKWEAPDVSAQDPGLRLIDHVVGNVEDGKMNEWSAFYEKVFGMMNFVHFDDADISTKFSALRSKVVRSKNWGVKLPLNEPAPGLKKSQIEEFLEFYGGPGVQHIALLTDDIAKTVSALRANGVDFLRVPDTYYEAIPQRVGKIDENMDTMKRLGILIDRDEDGYLLQLFTKPIEDRPTFFFEIIQRKGSPGFGQGNFQALFESIEAEQALRGNL